MILIQIERSVSYNAVELMMYGDTLSKQRTLINVHGLMPAIWDRAILTQARQSAGQSVAQVKRNLESFLLPSF